MNLRAAACWIYLAALTAGAALLRLWHLSKQIVGGDEIHVLRMVAERSLTEIPGTVTGYHFSPPLALLYRALAEIAPLTEWMLRLPMLAAGILLPALAAITARRFVPAGVALLLGALVAAHPLAVYFSRFIRPYAPSTLLVLATIPLLDRWHDRRRPGLLAAAAICAALAAWLHLLALLPAGLILLGALLREVFGPDARKIRMQEAGSTFGREIAPTTEPPESPAPRPSRLRAAVAVALTGVATLALTLLLFLPALSATRDDLFKDKLGEGDIGPDALARAARILAGMPDDAWPIAFAVLAAAGALVLAWRLRLRALPLLLPALLHPPLVLAIDPSLAEYGLALARYQFFVLPLWLLCAAVALERLLALLLAALRLAPPLRARILPHAAAAAGLALAATWFALGPLPKIHAAPNAYAHHNDFQTFAILDGSDGPAAADFALARARSPKAPVHHVYRRLGDPPLVYEWPPPRGFATSLYHWMQAVHGRPMKLLVAANDDSWWASPRLDLANVARLPATGPHGLEPGAVVILHRNVIAERERHKQVLTRDRQGFDAMRARLVERVGFPWYEDEYLVAFRVPPAPGE